MFLTLSFIALMSCILYVIFEPETEVCEGYTRFFFPKFIIKFLYRAIRYRKQGNINLPKHLVYVAGGGSGCLEIQPKNHRLKITGIRIDSMNLKNYRSLCGYKRYDTGVPLCYPETLFIKGLIQIITSSKFCLSPMGLIHIRQTIQQLEPVDSYLNTVFTLQLDVKEYRQTSRGVEVDIRHQLLANGKLPVSDGTVTLFSRSRASRSSSMRNQSFSKHIDADDMYDEVIDLDVAGDTGVQYARLSGDWNPFHLYKWSAQLFGFRLPIAHGMWTLSKALSIFQNKGYDLHNSKTEVSCSFKRPLFMPGRASIKIEDFGEIYGNGAEIVVEERDTGVPHLKANVKIL